MVEKRVPHYDLAGIRLLFPSVDRLRITTSASRDAFLIGYDHASVVRVIQTIKRRHFYKSMTADDNPAAWQDVYHVPDGGAVLYIKFTDNAINKMMVLSFKEM